MQWILKANHDSHPLFKCAWHENEQIIYGRIQRRNGFRIIRWLFIKFISFTFLMRFECFIGVYLNPFIWPVVWSKTKDDTEFWAKDFLGTWKDWILRMMKRINVCLYLILYDRMYRLKMKVAQSTCTHGESNVTACFIGILYIFHFFCFVQKLRKWVECSVFGTFCCIRFRFFPLK